MRENRDRGRDRESLQHQAEHTRSRSRAPIAGYLVILFAVAFLLLLMAYFQQQRLNDQTSETLKQSVSAVDALQKLMEDNEELREQADGLEKQLNDLQHELEEAQRVNDELTSYCTKHVGYESVLSALYCAEVKVSERDYTGAAAELTDLDPGYLLSVIRDYDAELEHYKPDGMFLRPRLDDLVSTLTRRGVLAEDWLPTEDQNT